MHKLSSVPGIPAPPMEKRAEPDKEPAWKRFVRSPYDVIPESERPDFSGRTVNTGGGLGIGALAGAGGLGSSYLALRRLGRRLDPSVNVPALALQAIRGSHASGQFGRMSDEYANQFMKWLTRGHKPGGGLLESLFGAGSLMPRFSKRRAVSKAKHFAELMGSTDVWPVVETFKKFRESIPKAPGIVKALKRMPWKGRALLAGLPILLGTGGYLAGREL